jgi:uncharacterized protein
MVGTERVAARTQAQTSPRHPGATGPGPARGWRVVAGIELAAAAVAVLSDAFIPSLVLVAMAALSLVVRRTGPASLGFHRVARPVRLVGLMLAVAVGMSLLNIALLMPITNHVSGRRQDLSGFVDLQGNLALLALYLVLGWTLAAVVEELAFRGYLLTRTTDLLGDSRIGVAVAVTLSAAIFATLHTEQGVVGAVIAGFDALVYGVLRYWQSTLWAPILAHGFVDTIGFVSFFLVGPIYGLW